MKITVEGDHKLKPKDLIKDSYALCVSMKQVHVSE